MPLLSRKRPDRLPSAVPDAALVERARQVAELLLPSSDRELGQRADALRDWQQSHPAEPVAAEQLVEAVALVREAARRTLGIQLYDVQLLAGLALVRNVVAEMQTGEGKTFTTALPAFVRSLAGRGVHVATSNAYLAERDHCQLRPLFQILQASTGLIEADQRTEAKRAAYRADVTWSAGSEFGFDYLRDQLTLRKTPPAPLGQGFLRILHGQPAEQPLTLQRGLHAAIVDEIDNVLIDDAGSPLLLSGQPDGPAADEAVHQAAFALASRMIDGQHFQLDPARGALTLLSEGQQLLWENTAGLPLKQLLRPWRHYVETALRARCLFRRDVHYIVREGKVLIVDDSTGRIFEVRTWRDGLHQAIEAREGLTITAEKDGLARITRQRFYRQYSHLCGITGTATGSESEFQKFYQLGVVPIPTHRPGRRRLLPPRFFSNASARWDALVTEVASLHASGQPVLIGSRSIASSEQVAERLRQRGVPFQLLNGTQDLEEAAIIAQAGQAGAITIATNMAGRGTDIKPSREALQRGGLHVIVTEHHDSNRIDRQLAGRAARQGEPGSARFYVSAEDTLIARHGAWLARVMQKSATSDGELKSDLSDAVQRVQQQATRHAWQQRLQLFHADQTRDTVMARLS